MTSPVSTPRALAIAAAEGTCPRCGAIRAADHRYCLDCGFALPRVSGRIAGLRRRWIARFGWYPGDWVWASLATLAVAAAGAAAAIAFTDARSGGPGFARVPAALSAAESPSAKAPPNGRTAWPPNEDGWTIVLVSYPKASGHEAALATAAEAARSGLPDVGVIDSSAYASLVPGYDVVFAGIYGSQEDADAAVATARQAGFAGAYSREIAR